jgi:hypothetical protein
MHKLWSFRWNMKWKEWESEQFISWYYSSIYLRDQVQPQKCIFPVVSLKASANEASTPMTEVDKVALQQAFLQVLGFSVRITPPLYSVIIINTIWCQQDSNIKQCRPQNNADALQMATWAATMMVTPVGPAHQGQMQCRTLQFWPCLLDHYLLGSQSNTWEAVNSTIKRKWNLLFMNGCKCITDCFSSCQDLKNASISFGWKRKILQCCV